MLWLLLAACSAPEPPAPIPSVETEVPAVITPELAWSAHVESVPVISWSAPAGATSWVEYGKEDVLERATPASADASVSLAVLGLAAGTTWTWRAVSEGPDGRVESAPATLTVPAAPAGLPSLVVDVALPDAQAPTGFVLGVAASGFGAPKSQAYVVIWDGTGAPVWWQVLEPGHTSVSPSIGATPGTIWWDDYDLSTPAGTATAWRARVDGSDLLVVPAPLGHHAVIELEPDVLAWPARDTRPSASGDMVTADRIYEAPVDATATPREVVGFYEDLFGGEFAPICDHPDQAYAYDGEFPVYEWSHLNSLAYLPERDAYLAHLRWIDALVLVDRASGAILWQMSGPSGDFTGADGSALWTSAADTVLSHCHLTDAWDGGLVAFDNGSHRSVPVSSIVELAWDERARTVREVFRWYDPQGRFVGLLGDVRKLPAGSYLASWSTLGEIGEVSPDGVEVWHATTSPPLAVSRIRWIPDLYAL